jgi:hypothetical protein
MFVIWGVLGLYVYTIPRGGKEDFAVGTICFCAIYEVRYPTVAWANL